MEYSKVMNAPLIFCSTAKSIHIQKIFKIALAKLFNLTLTIDEINLPGEPLLIYKDKHNEQLTQNSNNNERSNLRRKSSNGHSSNNNPSIQASPISVRSSYNHRHH